MTRFFKKQEGTILIVTFIFIFVLTSLSFALLLPVTTRKHALEYDIYTLRALNIAEAGLACSIDDFKKGGSGNIGTSEDPILYGDGEFYSRIGTDPEFGDGNLIISVGRFKNASVKISYSTVEGKKGVLVGSPDEGDTFAPSSAIVIGQFNKKSQGVGAAVLAIDDDVNISGSQGSIHANGKIVVKGKNVHITKKLSSSKEVSLQETENNEIETIEENVEPVELPRVRPENIKSDLEFVLANDGKIYDQNGNFLHDAKEDGKFQNWKFDGTEKDGKAKWKYDSSSGISGSYYIEGHVKIDKDVEKNNTWNVTIVATGHIEVSGDINMTPYHSNIGLIAGTDLKLNGEIIAALGLYAAHEQASLDKGVQIEGTLLIENASNIDQFLKDNEIGDSSFLYNGNLLLPLGLISFLDIVATTIDYNTED